MIVVCLPSPEYTCLMQSALNQAGTFSSRVLRSFVLPNGADRVVLYEWHGNENAREQNLVCLGPGGRVLWSAQLPPGAGADYFIRAEARTDGRCIRATTLSGYAVSLDPSNGRIVAAYLTKWIQA